MLRPDFIITLGFLWWEIPMGKNHIGKIKADISELQIFS
jgi:hypothetical protein